MDEKHRFHEYFDGKILYGADFDDEKIVEWFEMEREAYAGLWGAITYNKYAEHGVNIRHCYRFLPKKNNLRVLAIGSAYGEELLPIKDHVKSFTVLEPSEMFVKSELFGIPTTYIKPNPLGEFPFSEESFDLIVCFSVLHHIPNVPKIISEISRCLVTGGYAVLRDPIISLGDWRTSRKGLTQNERGIPLSIYRSTIKSAGLKIVEENLCIFSIWNRIRSILHIAPLNNPILVIIDSILCSLLFWNYTYHSTKWWQKIQPTSIAYVLSKENNISQNSCADRQ